MRVLVTAASRHGSTTDIAEEIAAALRAVLRMSDPGAVVDVRAAEQVSTLDGYDAVVLGSAVYLGHWLESARVLVESHQDTLSRIPVWLFSSGPIGDPPLPQEDPVDVEALCRQVKAREHQVFAGRLSKRVLRFTERAVVVALRAPEGDFRDWKAIREWASGVGEALSRGAQAPSADPDPSGTSSAG